MRKYISSCALIAALMVTGEAPLKAETVTCEIWNTVSGMVDCTGPSRAIYITDTGLWAVLANADGSYNCQNPGYLFLRQGRTQHPTTISSLGAGLHNEMVYPNSTRSLQLAVYRGQDDGPLKIDFDVTYCARSTSR